MPEFNEARSPLTLDNVQQWARTTYTSHFRALPRAGRLKWAELDEFHTGRPVWRSLGRSAHKRLLVIGGYAPGPDTNEDPVEQVLAHVHSDEAEVSFYRTVETEDGTVELQTCNSTSTVAFHAPFCDVGSDTGGSKAIHRVSALILYYFLAAGHVKELARNKSDPTMFTRNFKDACAWVENGGERPVVPPSRRSSGFIPSPPLSTIPARPKRSSTISSASQTISEDICSPPAKSPPIKRSATDSMSMNIKRERDEDVNSRPKKHPRRTLSEQIIIPSNLNDTMKSPRTPPPERVHRALQLRIDSLKAENTSLKDECVQQKVHLAEVEAEREEMRRDLEDVKRRLANLEDEVAILTPKPGRARRSP